MSRVSVIIPVYNVEQYLRRCLDSVLSQTLGDLEIICVDDGSTDGSAAILDEYAACDARIRVVRQPNGGVGAARNAGIDLATGEFLFFFDPDDWALPQMLERLHARAVEEQADVVVAGRLSSRRFLGRPIATRVDPALARLRPSFRPEACADRLFCGARPALWDKLFSHALVRKEGLRFPDLPYAEDLLFTVRALVRARRIAVEDRGYYVHWSGRAGSLHFQKDKAPLALIEAYDVLRDDLEKTGRLAVYEEGLRNLLSVCAVRYVVGFRDEKNVRRIHAALCERLTERELGAGTPTAFVRRAYARRFILRLLKIFRLVLGLTIREV